jgi:hypothetical protein
MLIWVGNRDLAHLTSLPAQHVETFDGLTGSGTHPAVKRPAKPAWWHSLYPFGGLEHSTDARLDSFNPRPMRGRRAEVQVLAQLVSVAETMRQGASVRPLATVTSPVRLEPSTSHLLRVLLGKGSAIRRRDRTYRDAARQVDHIVARRQGASGTIGQRPEECR